jgi:sec-independent protein translocase protein TatC
LLSFGKDILAPVISAKEYISFVVSIILGCGLIFQMPIVSFILTKAGLLNARLLRKQAKWAILLIFIIAAVITPTTDAINMLIFAVPMLILYEVSIWVSLLAR